MSEVQLNDGERFESLIKRFNKRVQQDTIIPETRRRQYFEPPSSTRKRKADMKLRKSRKTTLKNA